ncbi:MAG: CAP domain-containing protein [Anaerolineae bacterium]
MRAPLQVPPPRILLVVLLAIVVLVCAWGKAALAAPPDEVRQVIELINQERVRHGLHPLMHDPRLDVAAQRHSDDEAEHDYIGHDGTDGSTFWSRVVDVGFDPQVLGEVLAAGNNTADSAVQSWFHSPPHYEILMYPDLDWIGVGESTRAGTRYGYYWVAEVGVSGNPMPIPTATATPSLPAYPGPVVTPTPTIPPTPFPPNIISRLVPRLYLPDVIGGDRSGAR